MSRQPVEYVERKGKGHPDTICDSVMESIAVALASAYLEIAGRILHFNIDKGLLVAGQTEPKFGGGKVLEPMRLIVGDRATSRFDGKTIPVAEISEVAARQWFRDHLRFVKPDDPLVGAKRAASRFRGADRHLSWRQADRQRYVGRCRFRATQRDRKPGAFG